MLLYQPLGHGIGYSLELPAGWNVLVDSESGALRAFRGGNVAHAASATTITSGPSELGLLPHLLTQTLAYFATTTMKCYVRQGQPDVFEGQIDGRTALGYGWTDGVRMHATWFVAPIPSLAVEIDSVSWILEDGSAADARAEGERCLESFRWLATGGAAAR
jgi:hypothetical protein